MKRKIHLVFVLITFTALFVEVYTYKYFLFKHFLLSTDLLIGLTVILSFWILKDRPFKDSLITKFGKVILYLTKHLYVFLIPVYLYLMYLDSQYYSNYVFSNYHLQPNLLIRPIVFSVLLNIVDYLFNKLPYLLSNTSLLNKINIKSDIYYLTSISLIFAIFLINNLLLDASTLMPYVSAIIKNSNSSVDEKYEYMMTLKYGSYYKYVKLLKSIVPENSSLLLPPQKNPWQYEGNQRLTRNFLYPRILYSAHEPNLPDNIEFIEIIWGSTDFKPEFDNEYGWPKNRIDAEKIYIFDLEKGSTKIYYQNYDPEIFLTPGVYGLIKTK